MKNIQFCCTHRISQGKFINERLHRHFGMVIERLGRRQDVEFFQLLVQSYLDNNHRLRNVQEVYVGCVIIS